MPLIWKVVDTNIRGLCSNFVECESLLESNSPDILALCQTNFDDSIDSGNFSVSGDLLIRKDSITHMHGLAVYVKEGLSSRKLWRFLLTFLTGVTSLNVFLLFPVSITCVVMHSFWFYFIWNRWGSLDQPMCYCVCLLRLIIIRTVKPILVKLLDLVNSVIIFLSQMTLFRWLTFVLGSLSVTLKVLLFWIYLFLLRLLFNLQWLSLHWEVLIMLLSQFPLTF